MNPKRLIASILCVLCFGDVFAQAQDMDTELASLAEKLAASIKDHGNKKVTVIDFTDLEGGSSELGRYIAEQLTVNLVMGKRDFSVLDRANLKSILAEHKLTSQGLIDPENAKKLGLFSGVDALILGNIIPKGTNISLTAKIITTETAEIVGAGRAEFKMDATVSNFMSHAGTVKDFPDPNPPPAPPEKPFGDLQLSVESLKVVPAPGDPRYSRGTLTLIVSNSSASKTYGIAVDSDMYHNFRLSNDRGDEFQTGSVSGIENGYDNGSGFKGNLSDVPPKGSIIFVARSQILWSEKGGDYRPYRLQALFFFGPEQNGRHTTLKKYNVVMDIK